MFGYPCGFVRGNMFCGLFQDDVLVRLGAAEAASLVASGQARPFSPTPGRAMKEYVCLPSSETTRRDLLSGWLERALAFALTLPARPAKRARLVGHRS